MHLPIARYLKNRSKVKSEKAQKRHIGSFLKKNQVPKPIADALCRCRQVSGGRGDRGHREAAEAHATIVALEAESSARPSALVDDL